MLTSATIRFETLHDDKDKDSLIRITAVRAGSQSYASKADAFGDGMVFAENMTTDPFDLVIEDAGCTRADVEKGVTLDFEFETEGDDTWTFWYTLKLDFDNEPTMLFQSVPHQVVQMGGVRIKIGCLLSDEHPKMSWNATPIGGE
jgi:hypothetical protein